jgi:hypothetical protein
MQNSNSECVISIGAGPFLSLMLLRHRLRLIIVVFNNPFNRLNFDTAYRADIKISIIIPDITAQRDGFDLSEQHHPSMIVRAIHYFLRSGQTYFQRLLQKGWLVPFS